MIGRKLSGRYEIVAELGRGGMGVVYRARDPLLNRDVAVKLIPPSQFTSDSVHRFQREAQLVAQMDHPAIVSIYDFGRHEDALFFVMPIVQGTNLRTFLREGSVLGDVLDVAIQLAEALDYSHAREVVHRDIKPENIMVAREEGGGVRVRVMDFGLARATAESKLTKTGSLVGTLHYLSPEQVAAKNVDGRADIYALGTVLYECVVGQAPFVGETQAVLYRIVHEFPQPPRSLGAVIDEELEQIILSCLAKDPAQRPPRAGEVAEALKRYKGRLHDSDRARSVTGFTRSMVAPRPVLAPFVGRTKEFAELQQRLNAAVAGECQLVAVAGEPGIGKTRLTDELAALAKARQIRVLHGRSVEQDRTFAYQGFCEIIQEFFRGREAGSSPAPELSDLADDLLALFPMLGEISEIRSAVSGESKLARGGSVGPENRTQVFELLARTLARIGGGRPLVLVLEDLHGAEVTIEALPYIVTRLGPTSTLILGTYRSTEVDDRHPLTRVLDGFRDDRRFSLVTLGPFSPSEHRSFLESLVGGPELSGGLVERIFDATKGNPFFTKELVRSLLDSGGISRDDSGQWSLSGEVGLAANALPATIQQAVEKRIRRLPEDLREILATASVIGRTFDSRDLEAMAKGADIDEAIDRLVEQGLLAEERESRGELLSFSSGVVRDVLYAGLSPRKRRSLHRRCAEILESRHAGRLERVLPQLVHHFYEGDVPEKAVEYGLRQARASLDAFGAEEAARSAKVALGFLDEEWEGERAVEGEARMLLARALRMAGDTEGALQEAASAAGIFEKHGTSASVAAALLLAAESAWQARRSDEAGRWVEKGLEASRAAGDLESRRQFLSLAATLATLLGEYERAGTYQEELAHLAPATKETTEKPVPPGGTLVVGLVNPVRSLAPTGLETNEEFEIAASIYETLLATDSRGSLVSALCERWEAKEGGRTFLLNLRRGVRFSDGSPVTAREVKASIEACVRWAERDMPPAYAAIRGSAELRAGRADGIEGVVVEGDDRLEIRLLEPLPIYPAMLTAGTTGVVRAEPGSEGDRPRLLGTGPFRLARHETERVVLERSPQYWKETPPLLEAVEFRTALSATSMATGFRSGAIDLARDLAPEDLEQILRDPRLRKGFVETPTKNTYFALFNSQAGPVARQEAARRALASVVRTSDLVWRTLGRFAQPAVCLIPPGMPGHDPGRRARAISVAEAQEHLRSAGLALPLRLKASVHPLIRDRYGSLLSALVSIWSELGAEISMATMSLAAFLESGQASEGFDMLIGRWSADYDDPDDFTHSLFNSRTGHWRSWFSSPAADRILEEARSEGRPAVREALYRRFEGLLAEASALIPLFHDIDYRLAGPKVRGLTLQASLPYVNYSELGRVEAAEPEVDTRRRLGGIVHVPIAGSVGSLDPALTETFEQAEVLPTVFECLTRVDPGGARIAPWLAEEVRAEDGGRSYRFRLRDDVRFHDGRRLTARDVRYSWERLLQTPDSTLRWMFSPVKGARALLSGESADLAGFRIHATGEFSIELEEPVAFFPALISYAGAAIMPEGADPSGRGGPEGWVGTGPFRVTAFDPGRRLEVARNKAYWRRGYPRSEGLLFSFGVSPAEILGGFREGRFALASDLLPADVEVLRREPEFASRYHEAPRPVTYYAAFNVRRGPLTDRALRQRLVQAVDMPKLVRRTIGRLAIPAHGFIPPGLLGYEPAPLSGTILSPPPAGRAPAETVELTAAVHPLFFAGYAAFARELTSAFAQQGARLRPVNKTMDDWREATGHGTVDVVLGRWGVDYPDSDSMIYVLHSEGGWLGRFCGVPAIDRLAERGRTEALPAVRHAIYREVEEILAREAMILPLFHEQAYRFARPEVEGLSVSFGGDVAYEDLHLRG